jgi:hypothetical protein
MMVQRIVICGLAIFVGALCGCGPGNKTSEEDGTAKKSKPENEIEQKSDHPDEEGRQTHLVRPWTEDDDEALKELDHAGETAPAPVEPGAVTARAESAAHLLEIYVFNIGQADSMLMVGPGPTRKTLLVDLGEPTGGSRLPPDFDSSAQHVLKRIQEITGRSKVDYFLVTHYHSDHVGYGQGRSQGWGTGMIKLLSDFDIRFSVGKFIHIGDAGSQYMEVENDRGVYKTIKERMPIWERFNRVGEFAPPDFGTEQIDLGASVTVEILAFAGKVPDETSAFEQAERKGADYTRNPGNENDLSIALEVSAGEFEMFTAGDLNGTDDVNQHPFYVVRDFGETYTNIEHHIVSYWEETDRESDVEVYRANHHGSHYSSTVKLLNSLDPEFILYSTGADHGHPSNDVVRRGGETARQFATTSVKDALAFRAARGEQVGEIAILVAFDGKSYTINGERHRAFSSSQESDGDDEGEEDRTQ